MAIAVAVLLLSGVIVAVAWPLLRPELQPLRSDRGPASHLRQLEERKQSIYGAIRDLGLDVRTDKVTEEDYRQEIDKLKAEAVGVLAEIERLQGEMPRGPQTLEERIAAVRRDSGGDRAASFCTRCGKAASRDDLFCGGCGAALKVV